VAAGSSSSSSSSPWANIMGGHFHEADVKADACWGRPALRVYDEEVRSPNINSKNI
jgi:hypothetical protein